MVNGYNPQDFSYFYRGENLVQQAKIIGNLNYSKERFIEIVKTEVISKFPQK